MSKTTDKLIEQLNYIFDDLDDDNRPLKATLTAAEWRAIRYELTELARLQAVEAAAKKLLARMMFVYDTQMYMAVWSLWYSRFGNYKGPTWEKEQDDLAALLEKP